MADLARGPSSCILMSERGTCCGGRTPRRQSEGSHAWQTSLAVHQVASLYMSERGTCCGGRTPRRQGGVKGAMRGRPCSWSIKISTLMSERGSSCGGRTPRRQGGVKGAMRGRPRSRSIKLHPYVRTRHVLRRENPT